MPLSNNTNSNEALSISQLTHAVSSDRSRVSDAHFTESSNAHLTDHPSIHVSLVSETFILVSGNVGQAQIDNNVLSDVMSTDHINTSAAMLPTTSTLQKTCVDESYLDATPSTDFVPPYYNIICLALAKSPCNMIHAILYFHL